MDDLGDRIAILQKKLNKVTAIFIEYDNRKQDSIMVELEEMRQEIANFQAYVVRNPDERCLSVVRKKLIKYFDGSETKSLILDMGISDFEYTGKSVGEMHTELLGYCERRDMLSLLVKTLREHRPRIQWPDC